jgi:hypothetical protein
VTVAVPKLVEGYGCTVGRAGVDREASNVSDCASSATAAAGSAQSSTTTSAEWPITIPQKSRFISRAGDVVTRSKQAVSSRAVPGCKMIRRWRMIRGAAALSWARSIWLPQAPYQAPPVRLDAMSSPPLVFQRLLKGNSTPDLPFAPGRPSSCGIRKLFPTSALSPAQRVAAYAGHLDLSSPSRPQKHLQAPRLRWVKRRRCMQSCRAISVRASPRLVSLEGSMRKIPGAYSAPRREVQSHSGAASFIVGSFYEVIGFGLFAS